VADFLQLVQFILNIFRTSSFNCFSFVEKVPNSVAI
jgi:hypothetical protein